MKITPIDQPLEPLIKARQAAEYLGFTALTVRRMARDGRLPCIAFPMGRSGKHTHRFRVSDLQTYLATLERRPVQEDDLLLHENLVSRAS